LQKPGALTPSAATVLFQKLGKAYAQESDYNSATKLYQAALNLWDRFPGDGTKTNCEADLASCFENTGDYANAAKFMQMAYAVTRHWEGGNTPYNIYRACKLSEYYRRLKHYDLSLKYDQESKAMLQKYLIREYHRGNQEPGKLP
jgi:tetratricopeptide (TPR) repeat protein